MDREKEGGLIEKLDRKQRSLMNYLEELSLEYEIDGESQVARMRDSDKVVNRRYWCSGVVSYIKKLEMEDECYGQGAIDKEIYYVVLLSPFLSVYNFL